MLRGFLKDRKFLNQSLTAASIALIFLAVWLYKLGEWPGLHGDEALFGVAAHDYKTQGIRSLSGMTFYTGVLQNLSALIAFKMFGLGLWQLRIAGVLFNGLAVFLTAFWFLRAQREKMLYVFLLLLLQSSTILIYPRIAWEVASFNHFFLVLILISLSEIQKAGGRFPIFLFLLVNLGCTYNHFIGSAIGIALFLGFAITILINRESRYLELMGVVSLNAINLCVYMGAWFLVQGSFKGQILVLSFLAIVLILETRFIQEWQRLVEAVFHFFSTLRIPSWAYRLLVTAILLGFLWFHGWGLWAVLSNKALIAHVFSFEYPIVAQYIFKAIGIIFLGTFIWNLISGIWKTSAQLHAICIVGYLGILTILTTANATRYYMIAVDLVCLFLAMRIVENWGSKFSFLLVSCACVSLLLTFGGLVYLQSHPERKVKVFHTEITPSLAEPTGRFLPMESLLDTLKQRGVSEVISKQQVHNIGIPISFYLLMDDFRKPGGPVAVVEYDDERFGNGFKVKYTNPGPNGNRHK